MIMRIGELAALGAACAWAISSYTYSILGREIGASEVTLLRLPFQLAFVGTLCLWLGTDFSLSFTALSWLILSALLGGVAGDLFFYRAIMIIGPTLGMLLFSLNASFTALFGWMFLEELLSLQAVAGIALATVGVAWVITGRSETALLPGQEVPKGKRLVWGATMAAAAGAFVAISFIFLKMALKEGPDPLWTAYIRILVSTVLLWGAGLVRGWSKRAVRSLIQKPFFFWTLTWTSLFGGGGMWLANLSMKMAPVGVAATLIALQPILVTFLNAVMNRRIPSVRIIVGGLVAFWGTALVCLR